MINLSKKYIFGLEFYSDELIEIPYRGLTKALWKQNFPKIFQKISQTLTVKKIQFLPYKNEKLSDVIYLLEKN